MRLKHVVVSTEFQEIAGVRKKNLSFLYQNEYFILIKLRYYEHPFFLRRRENFSKMLFIIFY